MHNFYDYESSDCLSRFESVNILEPQGVKEKLEEETFVLIQEENRLLAGLLIKEETFESSLKGTVTDRTEKPLYMEEEVYSFECVGA